MSKNVTPNTSVDLVEILTQFETAINANMAQIESLSTSVDIWTKNCADLAVRVNELEHMLHEKTKVVTPSVVTPSVGTYRPTFGSVPVLAPKQTSPSKPSGKKKAGTKATPAPTPVTGSIDYAVVASQVIENTKKGVWNENLAQSQYLIESDPRLFLTPAQSGAFRRSYKAANVKYSDAATQLAATCKSLGWEYPS